MKHIAKQYAKRCIGVMLFFWGIITIYIVAAQGSTEFRVDDQLTWQFGTDIFAYRTDINFIYGGNEKVWMYLPRSIESLSSPEAVALTSGGGTGLCYGKLRGLYYNNERWERLRPIDPDTLLGLEIIYPSYSGMQITGGLFTNCIGLWATSWNVYGQVTITYRNGFYYLMAGTTYNFSANIHGTQATGSLELIGNSLSGYIWDSYGGIGEMVANSGCMDARTPAPDTVCVWTSFVQTSVCGHTQIVSWTMACGRTGKIVDPGQINQINIFSGPAQISWFIHTGIIFHTTWSFTISSTGTSWNSIIINTSGLTIRAVSWTWNGILLPPTLMSTWDSKRASFDKQGIPLQTQWNITRTILSTIQAGATTDSLVAVGGYFNVNLVVTGGNSWTILSIYRSEDGVTWDINRPNTTCTLDANLICSFMTDHFSYFGVIKETTTSVSSANTAKDNCRRNDLSTHNLSGANTGGIDYSPSYYDGNCSLVRYQGQNAVKPSVPSCTSYSTELNGAYVFARSFDITTIDICKKADMYGKLIRKDLAKMMVNFVKNTFGRTGIVVNDSKCKTFTDISHETQETQSYIQQACAYGLMWLDADGVTPQTKFNPYDKVTRAQFGTILSRFIWWIENNATSGVYYTQHLRALKQAGIMTQITNPKMQELRWRVMLTMQRIYNQAK